MPFSCFLFVLEKGSKSAGNAAIPTLSNALVTRTSTPPAQAAHVRFRTRKRVHTQLSEKNRTQRLARRNRGASLRSGAEYLVAASSLKEQPEKVDAHQWRVPAFPGTATPLGCGNLFFGSASATERTRDLCGLFPRHIAKYAANRCIYSTNLSIPFCAAPL